MKRASKDSHRATRKEGGIENSDPMGVSSKPSGSAGVKITRSTKKLTQRTIKELVQLLKRFESRLSNADIEKVRSAVEAARQAILDEDEVKTKAAQATLEELKKNRFDFAQKSTTREYVESIVVAVAIALLLRAFVIEAFKIPTGSMVPTLAVGDHIFVNKFIYGLRIPFTNAWFVQWSKPSRGDVIVFRYPPDPSKDYIKRVVAVPGDRISVKQGVVYVNGDALTRQNLGPYPYYDESLDESGRHYRGRVALPMRSFKENSAGQEAEYTILENPHPTSFFPGVGMIHFTWDEAVPRIRRPEQVGLQCKSGESSDPAGYCDVLPGYVFVMGDNRDNSADSRKWGAAPISHVKGKAMFVWASWGASWLDFRFDRLGRVIE